MAESEAAARNFEPSTAIRPTRTSPACAHRPNTWPKKPASASWWRTRKRATVAWSGTRFAQTTRNATSSRQRRSIRVSSAHRRSRRRRAASASSSGRGSRDRGRRRDRRRRRARGRAPRSPRSPTRPGGPHPTNRADPAATAGTDLDRSQGSSEPCPNRLRRAGRESALSGGICATPSRGSGSGCWMSGAFAPWAFTQIAQRPISCRIALPRNSAATR
jgi:hypothetical protein